MRLPVTSCHYKAHNSTMPDVRVVQEELPDCSIQDDDDDTFLFIDDDDIMKQQPAAVVKQQEQSTDDDIIMNKLSGFFLGIEQPTTTTTKSATRTGSPTSTFGFDLHQDNDESSMVTMKSTSSLTDRSTEEFRSDLPCCRRTVSPPRKSSMKRIRSFSSNSSTNSSTNDKLKPSVSFSSLSVREYTIALGDNPSCSYGIPISLGWEYEQRDNVPLLSNDRNNTLVLLTHHKRRHLLKRAGYKSNELRQCLRQVNRIKQERAVTELFLAVQPLEDAMETVVHGLCHAMSSLGKNK